MLLELLFGFLRVGCFAFGGAYGAIPLIRDVVLSYGWMDDEALTYLIAVSESTPGPIMVNLATYIGSRQAGLPGALTATLAVVFPSFCMILLIMMALKTALKNKYVQAVLGGLKPCITGIILATGVYMVFHHCLSFRSSLGTGLLAELSLDPRNTVVTLLLVVSMILWKKRFHKALSPVGIILLSACIGVVIYGAFEGNGGNRYGDDGQANDTSTQESQATHQEAQVLNLQLDTEVSTLDPQAAVDSASFEVIACMMEGLYTIDGNEMPILAMAESVTVSPDGRRYQFVLRDAAWSDGRPVTAEDFVYGWRRGIDPKNRNENSALFLTAGIAHAEEIYSGQLEAEKLGIRAIDEKSLEVELTHPQPFFISMLALPEFYPMNQEFYESCEGRYGTSPDTVLSNGAFCLEGYQPACQEIRLKKNENYWRKESVHLQEITYQVLKESQMAVMLYEQGQLDMALLSGEQAERCREWEDFQSIPLGSLWYISPNLKIPGLDNEALRKAVALCYDKEAASSQVMKDGSRAAYGAVPAKSVYGPGGEDFREEEVKYLETDKELARKYFEQAKKELNQEHFTFTLLIEDGESARNIGQYLQEEIQKTLPGVEIRLEPVPKKLRLERMAAGEYEMGLARWGADYSDPLAFLSMWTSDSAYNYGSWTDEAYDRIIEIAQKGADGEEARERWRLLHEAEAILMEKAGIFPVCEKANGILLERSVKGWQFHAVGVNRVWTNAWKEEDPAYP